MARCGLTSVSARVRFPAMCMGPCPLLHGCDRILWREMQEGGLHGFSPVTLTESELQVLLLTESGRLESMAVSAQISQDRIAALCSVVE